MSRQLNDCKEKLDQARAEAIGAERLREKLLTENKDQKSQSLIEMSKELQQARLECFRVTRQKNELDQRCTYLSSL